MKSKDILAIKTVNELQDLDADEIGERAITNAEFDHIFGLCDAIWMHSGNSKDPHAETTTGQCTNGFIDVLRVLRYTNLCEIFGLQLLRIIGETDFPEYTDTKKLWVVGSDHAGKAIAQSVATLLMAQHDSTEKDGTDKKLQLWRRFTVQPDEIVLQVEELITTLATLQKVRQGIREGNAIKPVTFAPFAVTLVHRSSVYEIDGDPILYLRHYDIETWDPAACPLCKQGSKRLKAKLNWAELTGKN